MDNDGEAISFAALLRGHRHAAGLTQEQLAERAGLSVHGIQKLERGATHPYRDTAQRLIAALGLDADEQARFRAAVVPMRRQGAGPQAGVTSRRPHNLPAVVTRLIGRADAVRELTQRLSETRLLTLTGVGGCGKTRLALEVARGMIDSYTGGVWLAELGPLLEPSAVAARLAGVLGIREIAGQPLSLTLANALRERQLLLIIDNCEHLLDACAELMDTLLHACPEVRILATSREPIGIGGEIAWRVPSLALPEADTTLSTQELAGAPAVQLFVERAAAVQPRFTITTNNAAAVVQICHRLDGIPLALELAAARIQSLTAEQIARRLDQRFRLLTGGSRAALPRQQTLLATLDWSYDLLRKTERMLFERLAVFSGGWTLEAAESVCAGGDVAGADVLDLLANLTRKSLVVVDAVSDIGVRYALLETVRDYARQKLVSAGASESRVLRDRHATFYLTWIERALPLMLIETPHQTIAQVKDALLEADTEYDNIRLMLTWCLDKDHPVAGVRACNRLVHYWESRGLYVEGRRWLEALLERAEAAGGSEAIQRVDRAVALMVIGTCALRQGDYSTSRGCHDEGIALWRELGNDLALAVALAERGLVAWLLGNPAEAMQFLQESRERGERCDRSNPIAGAYVMNTLRTLGMVARSQGDYERAAEYFRESAIHGGVTNNSGGYVVARGLSHLARTLFLDGKIPEARGRFGEALEIMQSDRLAGHSVADCLDWLAALADCDGRPREAAVLFGAAEAQWQASGANRYTPEQARYAAEVAGARSNLGSEEFAAAWAEGRAMNSHQALARAVEVVQARATSTRPSA